MITGASKGSKYYNQEEEKLNEVQQKVQCYQQKIEQVKANPRHFNRICEIVKKRIELAKTE